MRSIAWSYQITARRSSSTEQNSSQYTAPCCASAILWPLAMDPERSSTRTNRGCLSSTIQDGSVNPAVGPATAGSGIASVSNPSRSRIISQQDLPYLSSWSVSLSGSWSLGEQYSVIG